MEEEVKIENQSEESENPGTSSDNADVNDSNDSNDSSVLNETTDDDNEDLDYSARVRRRFEKFAQAKREAQQRINDLEQELAYYKSLYQKDASKEDISKEDISKEDIVIDNELGVAIVDGEPIPLKIWDKMKNLDNIDKLVEEKLQSKLSAIEQEKENIRFRAALEDALSSSIHDEFGDIDSAAKKVISDLAQSALQSQILALDRDGVPDTPETRQLLLDSVKDIIASIKHISGILANEQIKANKKDMNNRGTVSEDIINNNNNTKQQQNTRMQRIQEILKFINQ